MKLVTFSRHGETGIGVLVEATEIVDLGAAAPELPREMCAFLAAGEDALARARQAAAAGAHRLALGDVELQAPVLRPPKILAVGLNYADHVAESGRERPQVPMIFNKQSTAVTGPGGGIHKPRVSDQVDYEGELAFVVGRRCRHVPRQQASKVIAGYTIAHDVSVRDWQFRVPTFTMGKSFDTHCPLGPAIVTGDEVGDPHALDIETRVNGELRQKSNTRELIFNCFHLVEHLSTAFTLEPGDVVATGTPGGVGVAMKPPAFLKVGDSVSIRIDKLGELVNEVVAEPADTPKM